MPTPTPEDTLWHLVAARRQPAADTVAIDAKIWETFGETWAIMFTDLSGFSRQVARFGIIHFLQIIHEQKELLLPVVTAHGGILVKVEADSFMIIFKQPDSAIRCAVAMQHACQRVNLAHTPEEQVLLCVGLGYGRILRIGETDVFGAEVNAASKLGEDIAKSDEILVTGAMRDAWVGAVGISADAFSPLDVDVPGATSAFHYHYVRA